MPRPLPEDVRIALARGQKIEAIRLLRERTGLGLADAKAAVEDGLVPDAEAERGLAVQLPAEVSAALAAGNKLQAIKLLRQATGLSLKDAKIVADEANHMNTPQGSGRPDGLSPGEVPRRSWAGFVAFILLVLGVATWFFLFRG